MDEEKTSKLDRIIDKGTFMDWPLSQKLLDNEKCGKKILSIVTQNDEAVPVEIHTERKMYAASMSMGL